MVGEGNNFLYKSNSSLKESLYILTANQAEIYQTVEVNIVAEICGEIF